MGFRLGFLFFLLFFGGQLLGQGLPQPYSLYATAQHALANDQPQMVEKAIVETQQLFLNHFVVLRVRLDLAEYYFQVGRYDDVERLLRRFLRMPFNDDIIDKPALKLQIKLHAMKGNIKDAIHSYQELMFRYPNADDHFVILKTLERQGQKTPLILSDFLKTEAENRHYMRVLYEADLYEPLSDQAQYFIKTYPRSASLSKAYYYWGVSFFRDENFLEASRRFHRSLVTSGRDNQYLIHTQFYLGRSLQRIGREDEAIQQFLRILKARSEEKMVQEAYYHSIYYYWKYNNYTEGNRLLADLKRYLPQSEALDQIVWEKNFEKLQDNPGSQDFLSVLGPLVAQKYQKVIQHIMGGRWSMYDGLNQYPMNYYAFKVLTAHVNHQMEFDNFSPLLARIELLKDRGFGERALEEAFFQSFKKKGRKRQFSLDEEYDIARVYDLLGDHTTAVKRLDRLLLNEGFVYQDVPSKWIPVLYPRPHWDIVSKYANLYRMDPYLLMAMMREESRFDHGMVSKDGEIGVMQMHPKRARDVAKRLGVNYGRRHNEKDLEYNIRFAAFYMSWLLRSFDNRWDHALVAYDTEAKLTARWIKEGKLSSYFETKRYVRRVMNSYFIYKIVYDK